MKLTRTESNGISLAVLEGNGILVRTVQDAVDLLGNADYLGCRIAVVREDQLDPDFFVLRTRLAGEILQKFSNYRMRLVIIGDFSGYNNKSLHDFMWESNRVGRILFVKNIEEAITRLSQRKSGLQEN